MKCLTVISLVAGLIGTIVLAISAIRIFSALFRSLDTLESLTGVEFGSGKEDEEMNRNREKRKIGNMVSLSLTITGLLLMAASYLLQLIAAL